MSELDNILEYDEEEEITEEEISDLIYELRSVNDKLDKLSVIMNNSVLIDRYKYLYRLGKRPRDMLIYEIQYTKIRGELMSIKNPSELFLIEISAEFEEYFLQLVACGTLIKQVTLPIPYDMYTDNEDGDEMIIYVVKAMYLDEMENAAQEIVSGFLTYLSTQRQDIQSWGPAEFVNIAQSIVDFITDNISLLYETVDNEYVTINNGCFADVLKRVITNFYIRG